jgi:hypothetical protein
MYREAGAFGFIVAVHVGHLMYTLSIGKLSSVVHCTQFIMLVIVAMLETVDRCAL